MYEPFLTSGPAHHADPIPLSMVTRAHYRTDKCERSRDLYFSYTAAIASDSAD